MRAQPTSPISDRHTNIHQVDCVAQINFCFEHANVRLPYQSIQIRGCEYVIRYIFSYIFKRIIPALSPLTSVREVLLHYRDSNRESKDCLMSRNRGRYATNAGQHTISRSSGLRRDTDTNYVAASKKNTHKSIQNLTYLYMRTTN